MYMYIYICTYTYISHWRHYTVRFWQAAKWTISFCNQFFCCWALWDSAQSCGFYLIKPVWNLSLAEHCVWIIYGIRYVILIYIYWLQRCWLWPRVRKRSIDIKWTEGFWYCVTAHITASCQHDSSMQRRAREIIVGKHLTMEEEEETLSHWSAGSNVFLFFSFRNNNPLVVFVFAQRERDVWLQCCRFCGTTVMVAELLRNTCHESPAPEETFTVRPQWSPDIIFSFVSQVTKVVKNFRRTRHTLVEDFSYYHNAIHHCNEELHSALFTYFF